MINTNKWLLALLVLLLGSLLACHIFYQAPGFADDAYIYLHTVMNIMQEGTAQYFPIVHNPALLASSPLKLVLLVLAACCLWPFGVLARTVVAAKLIIIIAVFLTPLVFLYFYKNNLKDFKLWLALFIITEVLAFLFPTMPQFEGIQVFWIVFTLARGIFLDLLSPVAAGILFALLMLTRPEVCLGLMLASLVYWLMENGHIKNMNIKIKIKKLCCFSSGFLLIVLSWIMLATLWGVYPLPATWLVKAVQGKIFFSELFGSLMTSLIAHTFRLEYFPEVSASLLVIFLLSLLLAFKIQKALFFVIYFLVAALLLWHAPATYFWYGDNLVAACIGIFLAICFTQEKYTLKQLWAVIILSFFALIFYGCNIRGAHTHTARWDYDSRHYKIYRQIAALSEPGGRVNLKKLAQDLPAHAYIGSIEIGILAYFAGPQFWMADYAGLAQPGQLPQARKSALAFFYPKEMLTTAAGEYAELNAKAPGAYDDLWMLEDLILANKKNVHCDYFVATTDMCLIQKTQPGGLKD